MNFALRFENASGELRLSFPAGLARQNPIQRNRLATLRGAMKFHRLALIAFYRYGLDLMTAHEPAAAETKAPIIQRPPWPPSI